MYDKLIDRDGPSVGDGVERKLIEKLGGSGTTRKAYHTNADGSVTMMHTRGPGSRPEVSTKPAEFTPLQPSTQWSFCYAPLELVGDTYQPDTYFKSGFGTVGQENGYYYGPKNRRYGLVPISGGGYGIAVGESTYLIDATEPDSSKQVRGPYYWYNGDDVVTWTSYLAKLESGGWFDTPFNHVQYGSGNDIYVEEDTALFYLRAACTVYDGSSVPYVRVVLAAGDGLGGIEVRDYSDETTYTTHSCAVPDVLDVYKMAWAPDGKKLIAAYGTVAGFPTGVMIFDVPVPGAFGSIVLNYYPVKDLGLPSPHNPLVYNVGFSQYGGVCYTIGTDGVIVLSHPITILDADPDTYTTREDYTYANKLYVFQDDIERWSLDETYTMSITDQLFDTTPDTREVTYSEYVGKINPKCGMAAFLDGVVLLSSSDTYTVAEYTVSYEKDVVFPYNWVQTGTTYSAPVIDYRTSLLRNGSEFAKLPEAIPGNGVVEHADWDAKRQEGVFIYDYGCTGTINVDPWTIEGWLYKGGKWYPIHHNPDEPQPEYPIGYALYIGHY